jgi:modulator of FtsH protease
MQHYTTTAATDAGSINKVLSNTYRLLAMTLVFSGVCAYAGMGLSMVTGLVLSLVGLVTLFALMPLRNSAWALPMVFVFAGLEGASLGPIIAHYVATVGPELIVQALLTTGLVFFGLSGYVLTTKKDFSFLGGFLLVGLLVVIVAAIANLFFAVPAVSLALSAAVVLIMSGFILYDTSRIIQGGETNYVMATVSLYLNILNLFTALLHLLGVFGGDD